MAKVKTPWHKTERGKAAMRAYQQTAGCKAAAAAYRLRPNVIKMRRERLKAYYQTPAYKAKIRKRSQSVAFKTYAAHYAKRVAAHAKYMLRQLRPPRRYQVYRSNALRRGISFRLSFRRFMAFWQQPCDYCGSPIASIGLDRINSALGYVAGNVRPCCPTCNRSKSDGTLQQYIDHCAKVTAHQQTLARQASQLA
jgi:hypothetical protein